jgi:hypothetical protein
MNVNEKGTLGLIKVLEAITIAGWYAYPAFDDHSPVDILIMSKAGKVLRLQVKYRTRMTRVDVERYELAAKSIVNGKVVPIDRTLIDGWAVYMADRNEVKFVPISALESKKSINMNPETMYDAIDNWPVSRVV